MRCVTLLLLWKDFWIDWHNSSLPPNLKQAWSVGKSKRLIPDGEMPGPVMLGGIVNISKPPAIHSIPLPNLDAAI